MADLKLEMESLSAELTTAKQDIIVLTSENSLLKTDIANLRTSTEHQANHIVELEVELQQELFVDSVGAAGGEQLFAANPRDFARVRSGVR